MVGVLQVRDNLENMEALSPRDVNVYMKPQARQPIQKSKSVTVAKLTTNTKPPVKPKDHPPPPPQQVREPPSFDRRNGAIYNTGRLLGKGGFAICHEAVLEGSTQKFALKIVKSFMPQKKMEQKFQTELQIHSKMRHANIVQFHRAFTFEQSTYIVLELCPNASVMDMVKKRKFLSEPEVRFYSVQIAGAIKYMHGKGIIHRDLKMGNIFLDSQMNIKIGDFGLAAIILTGKDMTAIRRTTLCGTPNYIAPEILEKGKVGHDYAVDIWSFGVILFAMLAGKPPFQSDTQDEIYRKARELEYNWPEAEATANFISDEAKDLVAVLLTRPEDRPVPDDIVKHEFFVSGYFPKPEDITYQLREFHPDEGKFATNRRKCGPNGEYARIHFAACESSQVGPGSKPMSRRSARGIYHDMSREEKAGLTPHIPLPDNVVYRPYDEMVREGYNMPPAYVDELSSIVNTSNTSSIRDTGSLLSHPASRLITGPPVSAQRSTQSHAAQQRSAYQPAKTQASTKQEIIQRPLQPRMNMDDNATGSEAQQSQVEGVKRKTSGTMIIPRRPVKSIKEVTDTRAIGIRRTRSPLRQELKLSVTEVKVTEVRAIAMSDRPPYINGSKSATPDVTLDSQSETLVNNTTSAFSSSEIVQQFPTTRPDIVLDRVKTFHAELERALNSRTLANIRATAAPANPPVLVIKWVDYTNKYGLGYILSNGSVGCIYNRQSVTLTTASSRKVVTMPQSGLIVPESEHHVLRRDDPDYDQKHQILPVHMGCPIEFYENHADVGHARVKVASSAFSSEFGENGKKYFSQQTNEECAQLKRHQIVIWQKFANYMTANSRDKEKGLFASDPSRADEIPAKSDADVVMFYQRIGDVGIWLFLDGHFQFNFPDHTKIIISANGKWCDFYHLPLEVARDLSSTRSLPESALDDRSKLSYPLQTLLNFAVKPSARRGAAATSAQPGRSQKPTIDPSIQGIPEANNFRGKMMFIRDVIGEWIRNGGVGMWDKSVEGRLRWTGSRGGTKGMIKHVWTTVGAKGGDHRRVAMFDCEQPEKVYSDIQ